MENLDFNSVIEEILKQLDSPRQNWLLGAGISYESKIPLMFPLTQRVRSILEKNTDSEFFKIYSIIEEELQDNSHIEHILSHLSDLIALADRTKSKQAYIQGQAISKENLLKLYGAIISEISDIVRYGYAINDGVEEIGSYKDSIVEIEHHIKFVQAIYSNRSNLLSRSSLTFFTTNYDTLLEDALGLERFTVVDGFSGGAIGYWSPQIEFSNLNDLPNKCKLYKLHGSIDWYNDKDKGLVRTRYGTKYLANKSQIMIYPQASKYVETQKDPFSYLFNGFRSCLNSKEDNVLITCGYSFGDAHINAEIEAALTNRNNRTTLIAFIQESDNDDSVINETLDTWLIDKEFGNRIYVAGKNGVYYNNLSPLMPPNKSSLSWWTFSGLTNFILSGDYE